MFLIQEGLHSKDDAAEKAFDFKCNSTTKEKVVKTVADNFTKEEIDKIGSQGKPVVTNGSKNGDFRAFFRYAG